MEPNVSSDSGSAQLSAAVLAELRDLIAYASRPDRLYPIRSNKYYGFYAGHLPDGHQAFVDPCRNELLVRIFDRDGNFLRIDKRPIHLTADPEEPYLSVNDEELHNYLANAFGFVPGKILVKRYWVDLKSGEQLSIIDPVPDYFLEFVEGRAAYPSGDDQRHAESIRDWIKAGQFVLNFNNNYWLDADGEVESS